MTISALVWAFEQELPSAHKFVLVALGDATNGDGECWPSQSFIAKRCGLSRSRVNVILANLEEMGHLTIIAQQRSNGSEKSCRYRLNVPPEMLKAASRIAVDVQGFVYAAKSRGLIKIGITRHPTQRMKAITNASGSEVQLLKTWQGPMRTMRRIEREAHESLDKYRRKGEWFQITEEQAFEIIERLSLSYGETACQCPDDTAAVLPEHTLAVSQQDTLNPNSKQKKEPKDASLPGFDLPTWIDREAWIRFETMRKKIRGAPWTDGARELTISKLAKLRAAGHDVAAMLDHATMNSYRTVFEPKQPPQRNGFNGHAPAPSTVPISDWVLMLRKFYEGYKFSDEYGIAREEPVGTWDHKLGPKPDQKGCRVPAAAEEAYRLDRQKRQQQSPAKPAALNGRAPTPASQIASLRAS